MSGTDTQSNVSDRVCVIIVTRGRAGVLRACLESITDQHPPADEIVIVRGSEESFPDSLREEFGSLQIVLAECEEANISKARNIGLDHTSASIAVFIDDDAVARPGLFEAYLDSFENNPNAWAAGGTVLDARRPGMPPEFAHGCIHPSGRQIEVRSQPLRHPPRGWYPSVKGCNFALHLGRMPDGLRFDPFFRFAFDESALIMEIHAHGGEVVHVPDAIVEHLHAEGGYRGAGVMDRDWRTEFASHTRFMLLHSRGLERVFGWLIVWRRFGAHAARALAAMCMAKISPSHALRCIADAFAGIRRGASSLGTG